MDYSEVKMTEYDSGSGGYNVYRGGIDRYFSKLGKGTTFWFELIRTNKDGEPWK